MLNITRLSAENFARSQWSGGSTTQMAIEPAAAVYAERDFLWRLSSATVELEESDFTALPDYDRLIATLSTPIELSHNGGERFELKPYVVHAFDGGAETRCWGKCVDFNLMLRKGKAAGCARCVRSGDSFAAEGNTASESHVLYLYCVQGPLRLVCGSESLDLDAGDCAVLRGLKAEELAVEGENAAAMAAEAWLL